jgi:hypothetical protein
MKYYEKPYRHRSVCGKRSNLGDVWPLIPLYIDILLFNRQTNANVNVFSMFTLFLYFIETYFMLSFSMTHKLLIVYKLKKYYNYFAINLF